MVNYKYILKFKNCISLLLKYKGCVLPPPPHLLTTSVTLPTSHTSTSEVDKGGAAKWGNMIGRGILTSLGGY